MKTMTCSQMGGSCDASMTAATSEEMIAMGMTHVTENHPEMAAQIEASTPEEKEAWGTEFQAKWDAAPEDEEAETETVEEAPAA